MTAIKTTFTELTFDFLRQLILRTEEKTVKSVDTLWFDMSLIVDALKNLVYRIDPVGDRELIALGYIGLLEIEYYGFQPVRIMVKPTCKPPEEFQLLWDTDRVDAQQIVGADAEGNIMFTATRTDTYTPPPRTLPDRICFTQNFKKQEKQND